MSSDIPDGWSQSRLGDLFEITAGGDWDKTLFTSQRTARNKYAVVANALQPGATMGWSPYFRIDADSFTITGRGDVGKAIYRPEPIVPIVRLLALRQRHGDSAQFFAEYVNRYVRFSLESTGVPQLTAPQVRPTVVLRPPVHEQERIASTIRDCDEFIRDLERLVEKKRDIKQGLMQELLSGRTRLPGFTGEWHTRTIGDFAQVKAGGTPSTAVRRYWGGRVRWMSSGEIHKKRVTEVDGRITDDGLRESAAQVFPVGTVLMALAGQGKTRGTVAVSEVELATNQSIAGILPSGEHDPEFLYYNLDTRYDELRGESAGDGGRGGLNLTIIKKLPVSMPEIDEQRSVSRVLRDVDSEIAALSRRLQSARNIKQGIMQELLTGRTRLVSEVSR